MRVDKYPINCHSICNDLQSTTRDLYETQNLGKSIFTSPGIYTGVTPTQLSRILLYSSIAPLATCGSRISNLPVAVVDPFLTFFVVVHSHADEGEIRLGYMIFEKNT